MGPTFQAFSYQRLSFRSVVGFAALHPTYAAGDNTGGKRVGGMPDVGATQRVAPTGYSK